MKMQCPFLQYRASYKKRKENNSSSDLWGGYVPWSITFDNAASRKEIIDNYGFCSIKRLLPVEMDATFNVRVETGRRQSVRVWVRFNFVMARIVRDALVVHEFVRREFLWGASFSQALIYRVPVDLYGYLP